MNSIEPKFTILSIILSLISIVIGHNYAILEFIALSTEVSSFDLFFEIGLSKTLQIYFDSFSISMVIFYISAIAGSIYLAQRKISKIDVQKNELKNVCQQYKS